METINQYMTEDHRRCDELFAGAEDAASRGNWSACAEHFARFRDTIGHHFAMEETVLFPAFERATGMTSGPTQVMRGEHEQMRGLLELMNAGLNRHDRQAFLGHAETLLILMQQHNLKEENVLYPMADRSLRAEAGALVERMRAVETA